MPVSRRQFVTSSLAAVGAAAVRPPAPRSDAEAQRAATPAAQPAASTRVDPWLEIDRAALEYNVRTVARLAGGRPVLAVVKNNAYGLGISTAGPIFARFPQVWGFAVVRASEAFELRRAGVLKPILLMGPATDSEIGDLVLRDVRLAVWTDDAPARIAAVARRIGKQARVHLYVDTGMHRMGVPLASALALAESLAGQKVVAIEGAFTELTEDPEFDRGQAARLVSLAEAARAKGVSLGKLHAASSDAVFRPNEPTFLDLVRPGFALYGGYVTDEAMARGELKASYRLKARVIRVDELQPGDGVSYHRRFIADKPTRTATLAVGHVDGYPSGAVKGCEVLINGALCPVVGTVSASHTVVAVPASASANVGDVATLVGPDHPAIHPNEIAKRAGWSEYNMFMHLHPQLARRVV